MTTTSGKVAYMLSSFGRKWGLGIEAQAALSVLRVRTGIKFPEETYTTK